ncbi:hypothetical protein K7X08_030996 [Anisodus acutangulus]|uniref:Uncharacterized protein n=2 Tax=Anisodus TaxID=243963 RepID=A0A9Q1MVJ6_9SOLA|nr:hypothetical protein K7X08_030996 [Anisodus acutangulus]KAK4368585.1 hypothetical protein RND71_012377 [Anisodus tanguticus]
MAATPFQISMEEFRRFYKIDRALYSLLVNELQRDPLESMRTLALWIWMERTSLNDVVRKIYSLPNFLINELADEAATCLKCIEDNGFLLSTDASEIRLTQGLMAKEFSLQFFHEKRDVATSGIRNIASEVCLTALKDITVKALKRSSQQSLMGSSTSLVTPPGESSLTGRFAQLGLGGDMSTMRTIGQDVPREDRTMFVTFSKGYPVADWEIKEYFTGIFGECIECIYMQEVRPHEQALFARIVFITPAIIQFILYDVTKAKFTINGKHVWMRKYVAKNGNSLPPL